MAEELTTDPADGATAADGADATAAHGADATAADGAEAANDANDVTDTADDVTDTADDATAAGGPEAVGVGHDAEHADTTVPSSQGEPVDEADQVTTEIDLRDELPPELR